MKVLIGALAAAALTAGAAAADSFAPVRLGIHVSPIARVNKPLRISVRISADAGVLDDRLGALRIQVRLAPECGGDFQHTPGLVLLDKLLKPQPATGRAYTTVARGAKRPTSRGRRVVCAYLEEQRDDRVWAHDDSLTVKVLR
jgi:hypothetical protein